MRCRISGPLRVWRTGGLVCTDESLSGARIIDGKAIGLRITDEARWQVEQLSARGRRVRLDVITVGDSSAAEIYTNSQRRRCNEIGIDYRLHQLSNDSSDDDVRDTIHRLNADPDVTGILLNLPFPDSIDIAAMKYYIDPYKDVEGVNTANIGLLFYDNPIIAPCTALAVMEIVREAGTEVRGLNAVVVGQGDIAGKPISLFLLHEMATVTCCHVATRDLVEHTSRADLLVVAVGKPGLIRREHVKPGAIVIDVGINSVKLPDGTKRIVGDVAYEGALEVAGAITPVPGGVGPVTVAILLRNAAEAAAKQLATPRRLPDR